MTDADPRPAPAPLPELGFVVPIPGLGAARRYTVTALDADGVLFAMDSVDEAGLRLLVAQPWAFFPDYSPEVDDDWAAALGLGDASDALVFVVVTVGDTPAGSTANLLAPVVVNRSTGAAAQVVLAGADLPLRAPLVG
ncbi:MAG: flagellar assembly protein FliW [Kineosporiaceae bacterium]